MALAGSHQIIVIGGGICGLIFTKYARNLGFDVCLLEGENKVGGLWRKLPSWQDIQSRKEDWAINDTPIDGVTQPHILHNIESWVDRFHLAKSIHTGHPVSGI